MKVAYFNEHSKDIKLEIGQLEKPICNANEVVVKTSYAGLNHLDIFVLKGWPGLKLNMPHIPGADGAGIIDEVGVDVTNFRVGDKVLINPGISCMKCEFCLSGKQNLCKSFSIKGEHSNGTFAEYFSIPEVNLLRVPDSFPMDKAAAAPLAYLTAWRMLTTQAGIKYGYYVFIQGGSGGVSTCAIQIAKFFGARVIASTSTEEKVDYLKKIGADHVINYNKQSDYTKYVYKELTNRHGIDIAIDSVGSATFETSIKMLTNSGRLVTCGATTGPNVKLNLANVFWKQLKIIGSTMANQKEFRDVMRLVLDKKLKVIIDKEFSLDQAEDALKYMDKGEHIGKIVIKI